MLASEGGVVRCGLSTCKKMMNLIQVFSVKKTWIAGYPGFFQNS
jgi:hypothetical protein